MNLKKLSVQELNVNEIKSIDGGWLLWWFRISLGGYNAPVDMDAEIVGDPI